MTAYIVLILEARGLKYAMEVLNVVCEFCSFLSPILLSLPISFAFLGKDGAR